MNAKIGRNLSKTLGTRGVSRHDRSVSLRIYYNLLPGMRGQWAIPLLEKLRELLHDQPVFRQMFGII